MKYSCEIIIDLPIDKVVELWQNEAHFAKWQDGFESIEHLTGQRNETGAKAKIILKGKQRIELIETIITNNLPHEKKALYEHKHMNNTQSSRFENISSRQTKYISEVEYLKFKGGFIKIIVLLFPKKFKQQSEKWMQQFKNFAESTAQ